MPSPGALAVALLALSPATAPADSPIPLAPGTWWEYREITSERRDGLDSIEEAITRFALHRGRRGLFLAQTGGADPASGPVERGPGHLALAPWTGEDSLPIPLEVGRVGRGPAPGVAGFAVEALEKVSVPAGTFSAYRCAVRAYDRESVLWVAPGVGVVRETQGTPGQRPEIERVLLRWSGLR